MSFLYLAAGIALLYLGGEALVRGASALARRLGLSPLVIGLTVVAFGTSAPELATTLAAVLRGSPEVGFGNVVGSNVANLGLVLALCALIRPLTTTARFLRREMPFMVGGGVLLAAFMVDRAVGRLEGLVFLALLALFLLYLLRRPQESAAVEEVFEEHFQQPPTAAWLSGLAVVAGLGLLVWGAHLLVLGAVELARAAGLSERVIGLTMVAVGTSLPELASSLIAAYRREGDIALGNLVGSNVFNVLCILGLTAAVRPIRIDGPGLWLDLGAMIAVSLLVWPFLATGLVLKRWEGAVLLALYAAYTLSLFL